MKWFWISTPVFTVGVDLNDDYIITKTAPIVNKFRGQHVKKLLHWCERKWPMKVTYHIYGVPCDAPEQY
jgi:hypothetical protein